MSFRFHLNIFKSSFSQNIKVLKQFFLHFSSTCIHQTWQFYSCLYSEGFYWGLVHISFSWFYIFFSFYLVYCWKHGKRVTISGCWSKISKDQIFFLTLICQPDLCKWVQTFNFIFNYIMPCAYLKMTFQKTLAILDVIIQMGEYREVCL